MKRIYQILPVLVALFCLCGFSGLLIWHHGASDDAAAGLNDLTGDRQALASFPLLFELTDYLQTQRITITDGAVETAFHYGQPVDEPSSTQELYHTIFPSSSPDGQNTISADDSSPFSSTLFLNTNHVDFFLDLREYFSGTCLRIPSGLSITRKDTSLRVAFPDSTAEPFFDGENPPFYPSSASATAEDGTIFFAPIWSPFGKQTEVDGTLSLFRADHFIDYSPGTCEFSPEPAQTFGSATAIVSFPAAERGFLGLTCVENDVLLISHDAAQVYFTLYDAEGLFLDEYTLPLPASDAIPSYALYADGDTLNFVVYFEQEQGDQITHTTQFVSLSTANRHLTALYDQIAAEEYLYVELLCFREGKHLAVVSNWFSPDVLSNLILPGGSYIRPTLHTIRLIVHDPSGAELYSGELVTDRDDDQLYARTNLMRQRTFSRICLLDTTAKEGST